MWRFVAFASPRRHRGIQQQKRGDGGLHAPFRARFVLLCVRLVWVGRLSIGSQRRRCPAIRTRSAPAACSSSTPGEFTRIGTHAVSGRLCRSNDHEVVLTFDDGPMPPYTNSILDALAAQCVKATYFLVGEMAHAYPALVRRIYNAGHTIGTHSQNHPLRLPAPVDRAGRAGSRWRHRFGRRGARRSARRRAVLPHPRLRPHQVGRELSSPRRSLVTWSADVVADDWFRRHHARKRDRAQRAMRRLDAQGRGILLLHDIHPATAMALPVLLQRAQGERLSVVQVVAAGERPKSVPDLVASGCRPHWPGARIGETRRQPAAKLRALSAVRRHAGRLSSKHALGGYQAASAWSPPTAGGLRSRAVAVRATSRSLRLVRPRGLEPPRVAPLAPQASASTNSAMAAWGEDEKP